MGMVGIRVQLRDFSTTTSSHYTGQPLAPQKKSTCRMVQVKNYYKELTTVAPPTPPSL
jgi:hypothetical protein